MNEPFLVKPSWNERPSFELIRGVGMVHRRGWSCLDIFPQEEPELAYWVGGLPVRGWVGWISFPSCGGEKLKESNTIFCDWWCVGAAAAQALLARFSHLMNRKRGLSVSKQKYYSIPCT